MITRSQVCSFLTGSPCSDSSEQRITNVLAINDPDFSAESIGWCSDKNKDLLKELHAGTVIVSQEVFQEIQANERSYFAIPVDKPRSAFLKVLQEFFAEKKVFGSIHPTAVIDPSVVFNKDRVAIGANVVIERGCKLGDYVAIGPNTVIHSHTQIGNNCSIGANNTVGGVGFGYEQNEAGDYELMPHIGNVVLHDHVEIGNNVCIDRAVLGSTVLHENVKVDNLVHIAHGVKIGKNSLIIANAMIAGSVEIGEDVWVSPSASIRQKLSVADKALVGLGSVVVKSVEKGVVVAGNPAKPFEKK